MTRSGSGNYDFSRVIRELDKYQWMAVNTILASPKFVLPKPDKVTGGYSEGEHLLLKTVTTLKRNGLVRVKLERNKDLGFHRRVYPTKALRELVTGDVKGKVQPGKKGVKRWFGKFSTGV